MKKVLAALTVLVATTAGANSEVNEKYFQFNEPTVQEISEESLPALAPMENFGSCETPANLKANEPTLDPVDGLTVWVDKIINLGKKLWAVVEMGRPVVNVKTDTANALPQGITCWRDLAGWTPTQSKAYKISYKNALGADVVDFAFRVVYTTGGNYKGTGQYITNATVIPATINVAWGYKFDAETAVPTVFNSGSTEKPVGGMQMDVKWKVTTVLRHNEQGEVFYVGGNGDFKKLD